MKLRTLRKYLRPRFLLTSKGGYCPLCDKRTLFILTDTRETIRNHAICIRCRSCSRQRHVAICVVQEFRGAGITRMSDFSRHPELSVLNTSSGTPMARALGRTARVRISGAHRDLEVRRRGRARDVLQFHLRHQETLTSGPGAHAPR